MSSFSLCYIIDYVDLIMMSRFYVLIFIISWIYVIFKVNQYNVMWYIWSVTCVSSVIVIWISSASKTDNHDITERLLKVSLKKPITITHRHYEFEYFSGEMYMIIQHHMIKFFQWLLAGQWFSLGTPVSSTNKTDRYDDITEILLKMALNTITLTLFYF